MTVPIGTHPGAVSVLVGVDLPVATFSAPASVSELFLRRTDNGAGDVVTASLRNATGGGGDGIAITLGDGVDAAAASGAITGTDFYLRVSAADANSSNLTGWFLADSVSGVTTALTNLTRVKLYGKITTPEDDTVLSNIIAGVSKRFQNEIGRAVVSTVHVGELYDGHGRDTLTLDGWPILTFSEIRENGTAIEATEYVVLSDRGQLVRAKDGAAGLWTAGRLNHACDYTEGWATVPDDLALAADKQSVYEFQKRGSTIHNRGAVLDAGGDAQYLTGPWAPGVLSVLDLYRDLRAG